MALFSDKKFPDHCVQTWYRSGS